MLAMRCVVATNWDRIIIIIIIIITYNAIKVTLHSKLLQGHCPEFEFDDVHTLYANLAVRR